MRETVDSSLLTTPKSEKQLNPRELEMYQEHRRELLEWMLNEGQVPGAHIGYAQNTVENRAYRLDMFYRWVWDIEDGYTEDITIAHVNAWVKYISTQSYSESYKAAFQKAIRTLFKWQQHEQGKDVDWDPVVRFKDDSFPGSRDALTREERTSFREAALSYGSIPHYHSVTPEERDTWKAYLAQRLGKPKSKIGEEDWDQANSWKWPSLIWTAVDAGLRPKEVSRANVSWVDTQKGILRIPSEDAVKNNSRWEVGLRDRTVTLLENWAEERECYEKYDDSELLWLTKYGNPYATQSLNHWFQKLCDEAGIDRSNRDLSWYSIRHSVGRQMVKEMGVGAAAAQLRHKSMRSTLRYIRPSAEERKDALERIG